MKDIELAVKIHDDIDDNKDGNIDTEGSNKMFQYNNSFNQNDNSSLVMAPD